ncbi:hypothetical protein OIU85_019857, partial [Salix viminalis]
MKQPWISLPKYPTYFFFQTAYVPCRAARDSPCCSRRGWRDDALALQITETIRAK